MPARKGLGHVKDDLDGEWVSREEWRRKRGLVLYDGRAVSPEERALLAKADAGDAARRAWYRDVRRWHRDLRSPRKAGAARAELVKIDDPAAAEALRKFFADDPEAAVRSLMVTVLSRLPGDGPVPALADQAMRDVDAAVRGAAVAALVPPARRESAQPLLRGGLRSKENMTVRRSASALAAVGDARAVPDLIKSLVTTHYYKVAVPQSGVGMTTGPNGRSSFGGGGGGTANLPPQVAGALLTGQLPAGVNVLPNRTSRPGENPNREGRPHQPGGPRRPAETHRRHRPAPPPAGHLRRSPPGPRGGNSTAGRTERRRVLRASVGSAFARSIRTRRPLPRPPTRRPRTPSFDGRKVRLRVVRDEPVRFIPELRLVAEIDRLQSRRRRSRPAT